MSTDNQNDLASKPPEPDSTTQKMDHSEPNQLNGPLSHEKVGKRAQPDCIDSNGEPEAKRSKINNGDPVLTSMKIQESTRNGEMDDMAEHSNVENCQNDCLPQKTTSDVETLDKEPVDKQSVDKKNVDNETVDMPTVDMETEDVKSSQTVDISSQNTKTETNNIITDNDSKENEEKRTEITPETNEDNNVCSKTDNVEKENKFNSITELKEMVKTGLEETDTLNNADTNQDTKESAPKSDEIVLAENPKPSKPNLSKVPSDLPKEDLIRKLQEELRNEEAKLLLLKKLRQSQLQPIPTPKEHQALVNQQQQQQQQQQPQQQQHSQQHQHLHHQQQHQLAKVSSRNPNIPPPLVHGKNLYKGHPHSMPQLMRSNQMKPNRIQQGPPPLVMASSGRSSLQSLQVPQYQVRNQQLPISSSHGHVMRASQSYSSHHVSNSTQNMENQSPASRQAAAKLALRKQLEKTLLQIPPPKPPPPELHFLPSAANNEFIYLVGLEEVVNCILENNKTSKEKAPSKFIQPFQCAQCKSFFTTIWKHDTKNGIMCESCIVSNQKKALKAEHTNRLKTAFVKALQQEQEIEQRMQNQNATNMQQAHSHHQRTQQRIMNPAPSTHRPVQPINYAYIPQMIQKPSQDRHREYLLDMIPKGLNQTAGMVWK
ncbi:uncharacterized protein [Antedon mediterranea]|uniref:uncharacterized protein n=1 Tax=Antedon mediterranea TaxID=105859 RepID=UPI003AF93199